MSVLESIVVEGYKSIRSATVELGAINLMIGSNGAGKSNLVSLFGLLADLADRRLQLHIARQGGADAILHFGRRTTPRLHIALRFDPYEYMAELVPSAGDTLVFANESPLAEQRPEAIGGPPGMMMTEYMGGSGRKETGLLELERTTGVSSTIGTPIAEAMKAWRPFHFHDTGPTAPVKQKHKVDDNRVLHADGGNLAPFLRKLRIIAPGAYRRIVDAVRSVAPFFDDFLIEPDAINPGIIQLAWRHTSDDTLFTADTLSDGTLRFICLATLLLQPELPSLIIVDEPELGLHPFAITQLASLIRAAATRSQVILATQSVTLLDQFDAGEVIVTERSAGESSFRRLDEAALSDLELRHRSACVTCSLPIRSRSTAHS